MFCTVVVAFYMVETRGHSLEAIEKRYTEKKVTIAAKKGETVVTITETSVV